MKLKAIYRPGSPEWLRLMSLLEAITVRGRKLDKDQKRAFQLKGVLPRLAKLAENLMPGSPDLLTEPVQALMMPGTDSFTYPSSGPYAVHLGGGMYGRHIRTRRYPP